MVKQHRMSTKTCSPLLILFFNMHAAFAFGPFKYAQNTLKEDVLSICSPPSAFFQVHRISTILTSLFISRISAHQQTCFGFIYLFWSCFGCYYPCSHSGLAVWFCSVVPGLHLPSLKKMVFIVFCLTFWRLCNSPVPDKKGRLDICPSLLTVDRLETVTQ